MNYHRWSSLFRAYDLALGYNRAILIVTALGAALGFMLAGGDFRARAIQTVVAGVTVFGAAALAKEVSPDAARAAVPAAVAALPLITLSPPLAPLGLFWLIGNARFLNRTTGLPPKMTDIIVLLLATAALAWLVSPLCVLLMAMALVLDGLLPDGRRAHAGLGLLIAVAAAIWLTLDQRPAAPPPWWLGAILLSIAIGFMPVILNSYQVLSVGDATGRPLQAARVQAGQSFALSAGLFLASWLGVPGVLLLGGLWAALLGVGVYHLLVGRARRAVPSL
ncbi:hypothetical protein [Candidatus Promineifilum breve]|nr:hypothetical protein [Candidatus Promineifilum breve]